MPAPQPDDHPPLRLRVAGIGSAVELTLEGADAHDLHDRLAHAWGRCLSSPEPAVDAAEPDQRATVPGGWVGVRLAGVPFRRGGDTSPEPDHPLPKLLVTLDPAAPPSAGEGQVSGADSDALLVQTTQAITRLLIESQTGRLLMLHAGAVAHPETGRTVVFVAPGGTGKTTLVRTLAARYGYLSDETVAIDADYRVLPYPKPLSVRRPGAPKQELSPDELGLVLSPVDPTVVRLCLLDRVEGLAAPEVTELDLLDAITELTPQTSALYSLPEGLRTLARLIQATGPVLRLRYTEAEDLVPFLTTLLDNEDAPQPGHPAVQPGHPAVQPGYPAAQPGYPAAQPGHPTPQPRHPGLDPGSPTHPTTTPVASDAPRHVTPDPDPGSPDPEERSQPDPALRVHANRFADTLERAGEALILLREGGLLRLSPLGASIVEFALNPIRLDALATALERRFGHPEGADLLTATADRVQELAEQGLLTLGYPPLPNAEGPFWRISDDVAYVLSAPDRVVVFNLATPTEQPEALLGTAAVIWQFLLSEDGDNPRPWMDEPTLIADLAKAYATDPVTITPDVEAFLARLNASGHLARVLNPSSQVKAPEC